MKIPVSKKVIERIYGKEIDVPMTKFYFDPFIEYGNVKKNGIGYEIVLGRKGLNRNTIAHEIGHIVLGHLEQKERMTEIGIPAFQVNLAQDIEVELYLRTEGYNSAPQFTTEELAKAYEKVESLLEV